MEERRESIEILRCRADTAFGRGVRSGIHTLLVMIEIGRKGERKYQTTVYIHNLQALSGVIGD